jgi:hypothetical protein
MVIKTKRHVLILAEVQGYDKLSRCAFFVEKCIPFTNSAL